MGDVLDAWGQHVYWFYNDAGRLEYRLRDIWHLLNEVIPPEQRKPTYMMEYGVRGIATCAGKPSAANTYYAGDPACPAIWRTNIGGFQQFWFAVASAQLGYVGAAKWDAYWGVYDFTLNPPQVYWTIGPPTEGSSPDPVVPRARASLPHDRPRLESDPGRPVGLERLDRGDIRDRGSLQQRHARAGTRRLRRPERRADDPRPRHEGQGTERRVDGTAVPVQHRRPTEEHGVRRSLFGTRAATARTRSQGPSRRTPPAWRASRCRCRQRSR